MFYGRHHDLVNSYGVSVSHMTMDMFPVSQSQSDPFLFMACHRVCNKSNPPGATCGAGTVYPSGAHEFTPGF